MCHAMCSDTPIVHRLYGLQATVDTLKYKRGVSENLI